MNEPSPLKDAIMDAVYTPLERDDMQTPCALPFMTSTEYGVCDGDGCPVSDETIASALNAVAKIQAEYYKVKKGTQKGTQKEMTAEPSPRPSALLPWSVEGPFPGERPTRKRDGFPAYANIVNRVGVYVSQNLRPDVAALIVDAVNERDRLREEIGRLRDALKRIIEATYDIDMGCPDYRAIARAAIGEVQK